MLVRIMQCVLVVMLGGCGTSGYVPQRAVDLELGPIESLTVPEGVSKCWDPMVSDPAATVVFCRGSEQVFSISVDQSYDVIFEEVQLREESQVRTADGTMWHVYLGATGGTVARAELGDGAGAVFFFGEGNLPRGDAEQIMQSVKFSRQKRVPD